MAFYDWITILDTACELTLAQFLALWDGYQNYNNAGLSMVTGYGGTQSARAHGNSVVLGMTPSLHTNRGENAPAVDVTWRMKIDDITQRVNNTASGMNIMPDLSLLGPGTYSERVSLRVTPTGEIDLYMQNLPANGEYLYSIAKSAAGLVASGVWHKYRFKGDFKDAGGRWEVWLDDVSVLVYTGDTLLEGTVGECSSVQFLEGSGGSPTAIYWYGTELDDINIKVESEVLGRVAFKLVVT